MAGAVLVRLVYPRRMLVFLPRYATVSALLETMRVSASRDQAEGCQLVNRWMGNTYRLALVVAL